MSPSAPWDCPDAMAELSAMFTSFRLNTASPLAHRSPSSTAAPFPSPIRQCAGKPATWSWVRRAGASQTSGKVRGDDLSAYLLKVTTGRSASRMRKCRRGCHHGRHGAAAHPAGPGAGADGAAQPAEAAGRAAPHERTQGLCWYCMQWHCRAEQCVNQAACLTSHALMRTE